MIISPTPLSHIDFSIERVRQQVLSHNLQGKAAPFIGISTNHSTDESSLTDTYAESIRRAGGIPWIIPFSTDPALLTESVSRCDALVMSGGGDLLPAWMGEDPSPKMGNGNSYKDYYDLTLIQAALRFSVPLLGICRGMQLLNVALGGTLYQDLGSQFPSEVIGHTQTATRYELWHSVQLQAGGRLREILGKEHEVMVNSFHHQAVKDVAPGGVVSAMAPDGVIEGIDFYPEYNALGVQWHPEALACHGSSPHHCLFEWLVDEALLYRSARTFHEQELSVDTHCDTPMVFGQAEQYDFTTRGSQALVDLPRMLDGGLQTSCMVAYIPQGELTDEGRQHAFEYADQVLHRIDEVMSATEGRVVVSRGNEWSEHPASSTRFVIKGIENGYAIGTDLSRLSYFAKQGVRYITLCHNGDNDLCDSASRTHQTHGGLSPLGRDAVHEMNRLGIVIDVSHAHSNTLRDVLEESNAPIIASHSSCRALCDHPRNLTDTEIRAIAASGGIVQLCMYRGFVHTPSEEATLLHFIDHICHARDLVGAHHIGIGTDFDGDGEVAGCRDASQIIRITIELMRRGFTYIELQQLWGLNFAHLLRSNRMES